MSVAPGVKETRRRAAGVRMAFVAGQLDYLSEEKLTKQMEDDLRFLHDKEEQHLEGTLELIRTVNERLRKLASRMGVE